MSETTSTQIASRATVEQLRADIDQGRTGDKMAWPDPAAVPLGADEEAAGTPLSHSTESVAHLREAHITCDPPRSEGIGAAWILVGVVAVLGAGTLAWGLMQP